MSQIKRSFGFTWLIVGLALGFGLAYIILPALFFAPSSHSSVINETEIVDTRVNLKLTPKLVDSSERALGTGLSAFTQGKTYKHTTWLYQRHGETEFVVTVWGPGDDGKTHVVQIGRVSPGAFDIKFQKTTLVHYDATWATPADGYYWFDVEVP